MTLRRSARYCAAVILFAISSERASAQKDGLIAFPSVYKMQFENAWVRLIRVKLPGHAELADHTHPAGIMLHVYFNDADPVQFNHDGPPNDITRPPVKARSYRVGRATSETHSVINTGAGMSDYMRIELKTQGDEGQRSRVPTPPLLNENSTTVEVTNTQYQATRVTVARGGSIELSAMATQPALLLALTDGLVFEQSAESPVTASTGTEFFLDLNARVFVRNGGSVPVQLLRIDFLTRPM